MNAIALPERKQPNQYTGRLALSKSIKLQQLAITPFVLVLGGLFYSTGNFGLLNIFGVRREVQAILIALLLIISPLVLRRFCTLLKEPLFGAAIWVFLSSLVFRPKTLDIVNDFVSVLTVGLLFCISERQSGRVLKIIIILASIFSLMGIVQACILWTHPELVKLSAVGYSSTSAADSLEVTHPIVYLGFSIGDISYVGNHLFTRLMSFASEPSVIVYSLFVPGIVALSFRGVIRLLAIPILLFTFLIAASGTIWISLALGIAVWPLFFLMRRYKFLLIFPFVVVIGFYVFIATSTISDNVKTLTDVLAPVSEEYGALNKETSALVRLKGISEAIELCMRPQYAVLGAPVLPDLPCGLLLNYYLSSGVLGLFFCIKFMLKIYKELIDSYKQKGIAIKLMVILLYGTFTQVMCFSEYGWRTLSGMMILSLVTIRLKGWSGKIGQ